MGIKFSCVYLSRRFHICRSLISQIFLNCNNNNNNNNNNSKDNLKLKTRKIKYHYGICMGKPDILIWKMKSFSNVP